MTSNRSLDHLEREVEQNRAALVGTVDSLRASVLGEVEDVRRKVSFDYVGTEFRARVRANPLRSFAIGAGLALPLWRIGRRIPMPLLLIGAGVALTRPAAKDVIGDASARVARAGTRSGDALGSAWGSAKVAGTGIGDQLAAGAGGAQATVRAAANDAMARMGDATSTLADRGSALLQGGKDRLADAREGAGRHAARARSRAVDLFHENPLAVAGAGLALGALLAAIVPATDAEGRLADKVAPDLKQRASDLVDKGYDTVRAAAADAYHGAVGRAKDRGLTPEGAADAASELGGRVGAVVDAAVGRHGTGPSNEPDAHS